MNTLTKKLNDYLDMRRALGFKLARHEHELQKFIAFLHAQAAAFITTELALTWAQQPRQSSPSYHAKRLGMVRDFARYLSASDPRTEVPPQGLLPAQPQRAQPYIYRDDEILALVRGAAALRPTAGLRSHTYATLFGLLAVTGTRIGEILALDRDDVDLQRSVLTVTKSKFNKTRLVPLHESTVRKLKAYARRRNTLLSPAKSSALFVSECGARLNRCAVRHIFIRVSRLIGLREATDSHGPRLHDLRHTFAVKTLINWYRAGFNVEQRLLAFLKGL